MSHDDAESVDIHHLVELQSFFFHLVVDGEQVFSRPLHLGIDAGFPQTTDDLALDGVDDLAPVATGAAFDRFAQHPGAHGVERLEAELFQLVLHAGIPRRLAMGRRSRGFRAMRRRLSGRKEPRVRMLWVRSASLIRMTRMSWVMAIIILRKFSTWASFAIAELQLVELGDTGDQLGDGVAKLLGKIVLGDRGIFDDVVQHGSHQGLVIEAHVAQDAGHGNGMGDVGFTTGTHLSLVSITGHHIGLPELLNLLGWQVELAISLRFSNKYKTVPAAVKRQSVKLRVCPRVCEVFERL